MPKLSQLSVLLSVVSILIAPLIFLISADPRLLFINWKNFDYPSYKITEILELASRHNAWKQSSLMLVCDSNQLRLALRTRFPSSAYIRGKADNSLLSPIIATNGTLLINGVEQHMELHFYLNNDAVIDTIISDHLSDNALEKLSNFFGNTPPDHVSLMIYETGTFMRGRVASDAIHSFVRQCETQ